jgi:hypothetical protein
MQNCIAKIHHKNLFLIFLPFYCWSVLFRFLGIAVFGRPEQKIRESNWQGTGGEPPGSRNCFARRLFWRH